MLPYFVYELTAALPTALFSNCSMRKPQKSALAKAITHETTTIELRPTETKYVLDGGALLHRVKSYKTGSYLDTISLYLQYVAKIYGHETIIVFDAYTSGASTRITSISDGHQSHLQM